MKKISIIIVSYNTASLLFQCLDSVEDALKYKNLYKESEVIVVDNASVDQTQGIVKKNYPWVKLIINDHNLGYAKANNQGIKSSQGKYILLLNSDTRVKKESLNILLDKIIDNENTGVIGGKLLNRDGSVQQSAGYFPTLLKILFWMTFIDDIPVVASLIKPYHLSDKKYYNFVRSVDWVTGAFLLFRRELITSAGLLDEKIFMYGEEVEWCYRVKRNGYQILYYPKAEIFHDKGASSKDKETAGIVKEFQAILYFYRKHQPRWQYAIMKQLLLFGALLRLFLFGIIVRNPAKAKLYAKTIEVVR